MIPITPSNTIAPSVYITYPPSSLFKFPPPPLPQTLPPADAEFSIAHPFNINPELYNNLLHVAYPIAVSLSYMVAVRVANQINTNRENKAWSFSQTRVFYAFVIAHNVFLAIYSCWTFVGMANAIRPTWPGLNSEDGLAGAVDSLCKINGPRGLGSAATFDSATDTWGLTDTTMKLAGVNPDNTDVGRLWNEGLAYYGWLFYLSKFYEIVDTVIVLTKGKRSSPLQTYHHAGAMWCVWIGIRYMSPPCWMFVIVNSGIHTLMYTYYTIAALDIYVPQAVKRTLTTLQITQIIWGFVYSAAHLFLAYDIPISTPYLFVHNLSTAIPAAASSISSAAVSATAIAGVGAWLKKAAFRAAGAEGLAENVQNSQGETFGIDAIHAAEVEKAQEEIRYKTTYQTINCIDTSGQVVAILVNLLYLAPLAWMFVEFFVSSYIRSTRSKSSPDREHAFSKANRDALKGVESQIREAMSDGQGNDESELLNDTKAKLDDATKILKEGADKLSKNAKSAVKKGEERVRNAMKKGEEKARDNEEHISEARDSQDSPDSPEGDDKAYEEAKKAVNGVEKKGKESAEAITNGTKENQADTTVSDGSTDDQVEGTEGDVTGTDRDEMAYEVNPDEIKNEEERKAEEEMQPDNTSLGLTF